MKILLPVIYEEEVIYLNSKKPKHRTQEKDIEFEVKEELPEIGMELKYGPRLYTIFKGQYGPVMKLSDIIYLENFIYSSKFEYISNKYGKYLKGITSKDVELIFSLKFAKEIKSSKDVKEIVSSNFDYIQNTLSYLNDFFLWNDELYIPVPEISFFVDSTSVRIDFSKKDYVIGENGFHIPIKDYDLIKQMKENSFVYSTIDIVKTGYIENWRSIDIDFIKKTILPEFHKIEIIFNYINNRIFNENMLVLHDIYDTCDYDYIYDHIKINIVINAWENIINLFPKQSSIRFFIEKILVIQKSYLTFKSLE